MELKRTYDAQNTHRGSRRLVIVLAIILLAAAGYLTFLGTRGPAALSKADPKEDQPKASVEDTARFKAEVESLTRQNQASRNQVAALQDKIKLLEEELVAARSALKDRPQTQSVPAAKSQILVSLDSGFFRPGQAALSEKARNVLREVADEIKAQPDKNISVDGHTDDTPLSAINIRKYGTNLGLSVFRAVAVAEELISLGIEPERISVSGFGCARPLVPNTGPENRAKNRRVEIRLESKLSE